MGSRSGSFLEVLLEMMESSEARDSPRTRSRESKSSTDFTQENVRNTEDGDYDLEEEDTNEGEKKVK